MTGRDGSTVMTGRYRKEYEGCGGTDLVLSKDGGSHQTLEELLSLEHGIKRRLGL